MQSLPFPSKGMALFFSFLALILSPALGHGTLTDPAPRGLLPQSFWKDYEDTRFPDAPIDPFIHFPSGHKGLRPGDGIRSQIAQAGYWTPFDPLLPGFRWRAGICGDLMKPFPSAKHLRGGRFYYDAKPVRTYVQGGQIKIKFSVVSHHNGYVQAHICDVKKCGGEISRACFLNKDACHLLPRSWNRLCHANAKKCAPIDRQNPSRFYLPCADAVRKSVINDGKPLTLYMFGGKYFTVRLPRNFRCRHCVLHFFWTTANLCNPPGILEYYDGPDRPRNWGKCFGQGGASGGVTRVQRNCSRSVFPEEYYQCADVRVLGRGEPFYSPAEKRKITGRLLPFVYYIKPGERGQPVRIAKIYPDEHKVFYLSDCEKVDFLVNPRRPVKGGIQFKLTVIYGKNETHLMPISQSLRSPFYLGGTDENGYPRYWHGGLIGRNQNIHVISDEDRLMFSVLFLRRLT